MNIIKMPTIAKIAEIYQKLLMAVNAYATAWTYALTQVFYIILRRTDPAGI